MPLEMALPRSRSGRVVSAFRLAVLSLPLCGAFARKVHVAQVPIGLATAPAALEEPTAGNLLSTSAELDAADSETAEDEPSDLESTEFEPVDLEPAKAHAVEVQPAQPVELEVVHSIEQGLRSSARDEAPFALADLAPSLAGSTNVTMHNLMFLVQSARVASVSAATWDHDIFETPKERNTSSLLSAAPAGDWLLLLVTTLVLIALDAVVLRRFAPRDDGLTEETRKLLLEIFQGCDVNGLGRVTRRDLVAACESREDAAAALFGAVTPRGGGGKSAAAEAMFERLAGRVDRMISWEELEAFYTKEVRPRKRGMSEMRTHAYVIAFWICAGAAFSCTVFVRRGREQGFEWWSGYLLEWILSMDNLFVFHLIFQTYATPRPQLHKALFLGILGAAAFRMMFFTALSSLLHMVSWIRLVFGMLLIYSGVQAARSDDDADEMDVENNSVIRCLRRYLGARILDTYDAEGHRLVVWQEGRWYLTLLVPVVICVEITDVLFALDSVSAKVAQIPDYYICYSSSILAIFGLRAMFFIIQDLVDCFELMKYGLCLILVFIGLELITSDFVRLPAQVVCLVIIAVFVVCIAGSAAYHRCTTPSMEKQEALPTEVCNKDVGAC